MGQSFKGFSKALSLILAVAMVVTMVPTSAYGAELLTADESADLLISNDNVAEEASDALVNDASASEEKSSSLIDTQKASAPSEDLDENTAGKEVNPDKSYGDVEITFTPTATVAFERIDDGTALSGAINADSELESGYSFYAVVHPGYVPPTDDKDWFTPSYWDYNNVMKTDNETGRVAVKRADMPSITVSPVSGNDHKKLVTLSKALFADVIAKSAWKDDDSHKVEFTITGKSLTDLMQKEIPSANIIFSDDSEHIEVTRGVRTAEYVPASGTPNRDVWRLTNLAQYVTNKAIYADGITISYTPTGKDEEIYDVAGNSATVDIAANPKVYAKLDNSGNLDIAAALVNAFVTGKGDLKINVDTSKADKTKCAVTLDTTNANVEIKDGLGQAITNSTIIDATASYSIVIKGAATTHNIGTRIIEDVKITDSKGKDITPAIAAGNLGTNTVTYTFGANVLKDDIKVTVVSDEEVRGTTSTTNYKVYDVLGAAPTYAESNSKYSFQVVPDKGYTVTNVVYYLSDDEEHKVTLQPTSDNFYETTGVVNESITILPTVSAITVGYDVTVTSAETGMVVYNGNNTSDAFSVGTAKNNAAVNGKPYYFTVKVSAATEEPDGIFYTMSDYTDEAELINHSGQYYLYMIPNVSGNVELDVSESTIASALVIAPVNPLVKVDRLEDNTSITVDNDEDFYFSVTTTDPSIVASKVTYRKGNSGPEAAPLTVGANGKYYIDATTMASFGTTAGTDDLQLRVYTTETLATTSVFVAAGETPTNPTDSTMLLNTYKDKAKTKVDTQTLTMIIGETSPELSVVFTDASGRLNSSTGTITIDENKAADKKVFKAESVAPNQVITLNTDASYHVTATAAKEGNDNITVTYEETDNTNAFNTLKVSATLPAVVKPAYSDFRVAIKDHAGNAKEALMVDGATVAASDAAEVSVYGTNSRTGKESEIASVASPITSIVWSFDPDIASTVTGDRTYQYVTAYNDAYNSPATGLNSNSGTQISAAKAVIKAIKAQDDPVLVKATITQGTDVKFAEAPLYLVGKDVFTKYPSAQVATKTKVEGTSGTYTGLVLEKNGAMNSATLGLDVYEVPSGAAVTLTNSSDLAIANANGSILKVTDDIVWDYKLTNNNTDDKDNEIKYVEVVNNNDGTFTVTPNIISSYTSTLKAFATIDGYRAAEQVFTFTVTDRVAKSEVYLMLNDSARFEADGTTVTTQELTDAFIAGREVSKVVKNINNPSITSADEGIKFTAVTNGSAFKLPEKDSFKSLGAYRKLVAWKNTGTNNYYAPGEEVTVSGTAANDTYAAVFQDGYKFVEYNSTASPATDRSTRKGGIAIYSTTGATYDKEKKEYTAVSAAWAACTTGGIPTGSTALSMGSTVNTILKLQAADEVDTSSRSALKTGKTVYVASNISFSSEDPDAEFLTFGNSAITAKTHTVGVDDIAFKASWTDPDDENAVYETCDMLVDVTKAPIYAFTGVPATYELEVDQVATNVITAALTNNGTGVTVSDYDWVWSSDNEDVAKVKAGSAVNKATITPISVGTANITVTATNKADGSIATATTALTVKAGAVKVEIVDPDGNKVDRVYAKANASTEGTGYKLTVDKDVTWTTSAADVDSTVVTAGTLDSLAIKLTTADIELSDKGSVTYAYKYGSKNYQKVVPVSTYYPITLQSNDKALTDSDCVAITEDGAMLVNAAGTAAVDGVVKVTTANKKETKVGTTTYTTYENISLAAFAAEKLNPSDGLIEFAGWQDANPASKPVYTDKVDISLDRATLKAGTYALTPLFQNKTVDKVTVAQTTYTLKNEITTAGGKADYKSVAMTVSPYDSKQNLQIVPSTDGRFMLVKGDSTTLTDPTTAFTGSVMTLTAGTATNKESVVITTAGNESRTDMFTVAAVTDGYGVDPTARRAGQVKFDVKANDIVKETITFNIEGYDTVDKVYYGSDGAVVKNDMRTVNGTVWFFDENGARVTGNKVITKADGTKILIVSPGVVAPAGRNTIDGKSYYIGENGVIKTGWLDASGSASTAAAGIYYADPETGILASGLTTIGGIKYAFSTSDNKIGRATNTKGEHELINGYYVDATGEVAIAKLIKVADKQFLVNEEGALVTYAMTTDGKITVGGVAYIIDKDTNEAKRDDILYNPQVTWTEKFPAKFTKGSAMPVLKFKVTYTSANTGETKTSDEISVTATTTDDVSVASKITAATFTATADLTGYFTDKEGKTPAVNVTITQKYTFKDGGLDGVAGTYTYKSHAFTWPKELGSATKPAVTATVTYKYEEEGAAATTVTLDAAVTVSDAVVDGKFKKFTATLNTIDGLTKEETKKYNAETGHFGGDGIEVVGLEEEYDYTGKPIKPAFTVVDNVLDKVLVEGTDYSVSYKDNKKVGTATITIKGKNNYGEKGGEIIKQFKIVDPVAEEKPEDYFTVKSVKVASKDGFTYDGTEKYPKTLTIKTSEGDVTAEWDGSSYGLNVDSTKELKIVVTDNIKKGSGVVAVYGNNGKGAFVTKTATFSIKPCDLSTVSVEDLTITPDAVAWAVKGATPAVEVSYKGDVLVEGRDYTLSWKYTNKKNAGENAGEVTVKGKNNFTKKASAVKFDIGALDLNDVKFTVAAYDGVKAKAVKVVAYDQAGVVIPAKQYKVKIEKDGTDITTSKDALKSGDEITVTLEPATTNLDGSATANITVAANLAKVKVVVPKTFTKTYTGQPIELTSEDFESGKISVGSLEFGTDFEVVAYQNNVKKGTMTAYIQGVSDKCSGTGKIKVKIVPQKVKEDK
jgi:hypothetical protein